MSYTPSMPTAKLNTGMPDYVGSLYRGYQAGTLPARTSADLLSKALKSKYDAFKAGPEYQSAMLDFLRGQGAHMWGETNKLNQDMRETQMVNDILARRYGRSSPPRNDESSYSSDGSSVNSNYDTTGNTGAPHAIGPVGQQELERVSGDDSSTLASPRVRPSPIDNSNVPGINPEGPGANYGEPTARNTFRGRYAASSNIQQPVNPTSDLAPEEKALLKKHGYDVDYESPEQKRIAETNEKAKVAQQEIDIKEKDSLEKEAPLYKQKLEDVRRALKIAKSHPEFFGPATPLLSAFSGPAYRQRHAPGKTKAYGEFQDILGRLVAMRSMELSSKGLAAALKLAAQQKADFSDQPQAAVGKLKAMETELLRGLNNAESTYKRKNHKDLWQTIEQSRPSDKDPNDIVHFYDEHTKTRVKMTRAAAEKKLREMGANNG